MAIGLLVLRVMTFPGAAVLLPMLLTAALVATGWFADPVLPAPVLNAGYVIIGIQVGLKFTRPTLGIIARSCHWRSSRSPAPSSPAPASAG